ncbi:MAG: CDGSH iron-sulfur domain-containing protein [Bacteroidota bacterium]|nr:CDGSH iron-sulfur domain-containing protein [Bacteroidota bacterium]
MNITEKRSAGFKSIRQELEPGIYSYCNCGWSSNQPFCDGSHHGTGMLPTKLLFEDKTTISFCTCKMSSKGHICDGSHKTLDGFMKPVL